MWPSHGKTNRAGFRVTLRVQPLREQENGRLEATPEPYGRTLSRRSKSSASQGAQADASAAIGPQIFNSASERRAVSCDAATRSRTKRVRLRAADLAAHARTAIQRRGDFNGLEGPARPMHRAGQAVSLSISRTLSVSSLLRIASSTSTSARFASRAWASACWARNSAATCLSI
jgi:hypothetical protein